VGQSIGRTSSSDYTTDQSPRDAPPLSTAWHAEERPAGESSVIRDAEGQTSVYVYFAMIRSGKCRLSV
jgi:hypothetical protein